MTIFFKFMNNLNNIAFILHHGWGLNQNYWKNLILNLFSKNISSDDIFLCEAGYYKNLARTNLENITNFAFEKKLQNKKIIGIGHSIGFAKLLNQKDQIHFDYLFGLQSFINFLGNNDQGAIQGYQNFCNFFKESPSKVLEGFNKQIGFDENFCDNENLNLDLLQNDLNLLNNKLSHLFDKLEDLNYKIFASKDDYVVPAKIVKQNFPNDKIIFFENYNHYLGFLDSEKVLNLVYENIYQIF